MKTTVVGSYPSFPSMETMMSGYYHHIDMYAGCLAESVDEQVRAGVDIITDGQTRGDMMTIFAQKILGMRLKGKPHIINELKLPESINLADTLKAKELAAGRAEIKAPITGPSTLFNFCINQYYDDTTEGVMALARVLNKEARFLDPHVALFQFDEPYFAVEYPEYAEELMKTLTAGLTKPVALHVCGKVHKLLPDLINLPVDILDHEFAANPGLFDVVKELDMKQSIGLGCVINNVDEVETVETIANRIRPAAEHFGTDRLYIDPDCGLRHIKKESAFAKLQNMVEAAKQIEKEFR